MKKILAFSTIILFLCAPSVFADDRVAVKKLVVETIDEVVNLIRDKSLDKKVRDDKIIQKVKPVIDFDRMAKLSLGKKNWKRMNKSQRKEFSKLFIDRLQESFLEKLDLYTDEKVEYGKAKQIKKKIYVEALLISKDDKIDMLFKFQFSAPDHFIQELGIMQDVEIAPQFRVLIFDHMIIMRGHCHNGFEFTFLKRRDIDF